MEDGKVIQELYDKYKDLEKKMQRAKKKFDDEIQSTKDELSLDNVESYELTDNLIMRFVQASKKVKVTDKVTPEDVEEINRIMGFDVLEVSERAASVRVLSKKGD